MSRRVVIGYLVLLPDSLRAFLFSKESSDSVDQELSEAWGPSGSVRYYSNLSVQLAAPLSQVFHA